MSIFDYEGDGSEDEATLFSLSGEYLEAAKTLKSVPPTKVNYEIVTYYLLGHAAELSLKSYLFNQGVSIQELRQIGHDLSSSIDKGIEFGLNDYTSIRDLSPIYKAKKSEYRQNRSETFPSADRLIDEITELRSVAFNNISEF
ncbi:hypothetical protein [Salinicola halophyticus]|uniref:hypothetical protein n=1 Tax=Salinicola halophyticus TaxID=1808881 RepID=UPI000DA1D9F2|nr:hypothetical protein [Salinicola halophyticus]